jgi:hypothetical protein
VTTGTLNAGLSRALDLVARVECRSEGSGEEHPVAVWLADRRCLVCGVLTDAVVGPVAAGAPAERRLLVVLEEGTRLELRRRLPDGSWRVRRPS